MSEEFHYSGSELELFQNAVNWKGTLSRHIRPFVKGCVLEVGAGIGGTTRILRTGFESSWTCLEPDFAMASSIQAEFPSIEVNVGTLESIPPNQLFDSILYVDVLEHIEKDSEEIRIAFKHLRAGGYLVILVPAHQWLFSNFDKAIGHYRRYSHKTMRSMALPNMIEVKMAYLDSVGLLASVANKIVLTQACPTSGQIHFWDKYLVKASRVIDPISGYRIGKSLLAVWQMEG